MEVEKLIDLNGAIVRLDQISVIIKSFSIIKPHYKILIYIKNIKNSIILSFSNIKDRDNRYKEIVHIWEKGLEFLEK